MVKGDIIETWVMMGCTLGSKRKSDFVLVCSECCCIRGMHLSIHYTIVLEGCISQYIRLLYWRDASHNTLDCCIGGMHLTIH